MAKFSIYSSNGRTVRYTGTPKYNGTYLKVSYLEFSEIASPVKIEWEVGDYVDYPRTGLRYRLYSLPQPKKSARTGAYGGAYTYSNVQLHAATKELEIALFQDLVLDVEKNVHFSTQEDLSTYEDVYGIAARLQASMDAFFPNAWVFRVMDLDETEDADLLELLRTPKEFSLSNGTILGALNNIYNTWEGIGWIHTYDATLQRDVITIGRPNKRDSSNTTSQFVYGLGKGLTAIKKSYTNTDEFGTRLYVYGSDRNIPAKYYNGKAICNAESVNIVNLMLPLSSWGKSVDPVTGETRPDPFLAYIEDPIKVAKYGLIPRKVYYNGSDNDEIYPSVKNITAGRLRTAKAEAGDDTYVPSTAIYPDEERMDKVSSCVNPSDDGVTVEGGEYRGDETKAVSFPATVGFIGASNDCKTNLPSSYKTPFSVNLIEFDTAYQTNRVSIAPDLTLKFTFYKSSTTSDAAAAGRPGGSEGTGSSTPADGYTGTESGVYNGDTPVVYQQVTYYVRKSDGTLEQEVKNKTALSVEGVELRRAGTVIAYLSWSSALKAESIITTAGNVERVQISLIFDRTYNTETDTEYNIEAATGSIVCGYRDTLPNTFTLVLKQIGFDISKCTGTASSGKATISMLDGQCGGRDFAVKSCTYRQATDTWELTVKRAQDESLGMLFPNKNHPILTGDTFVLLDIVMPDLYVTIAEQKLLEVATALYAEISRGKTYYEPDIDAKVLAFSGEKLKEGMYMQVKDADVVEEGVDYIIIDTLRISEDESNIPTYKVTLREKKKSTVVDATTAALRDLSAEIRASQGGWLSNIINSASSTPAADDNVYSALRSHLEFLSKKYDDIAEGFITLKQGVQFGKSFASGVTGFGGKIDGGGAAELESLTLRRFLEVPELRYNRISVNVGNSWRAPGGGIIESVTPDYASDGSMLNTGTITLHLEGGEIGLVALDDICMGIFHDALTVDSNALVDSDDGIGNFKFSGFYTTYFRVTEILADDNSSFRYAIRPVSDTWAEKHHPCAAMHFVAYGNFSDKDRQTSRYSTRTYERYLKDVAGWEFTENNIGAQFGDLSNLTIFGRDMRGYSAYLNNIYMSGVIEQFTLLPLRMEIDNQGMDALAYGESMLVTCTVWKGWDEVTDSVAGWKIVRDSGDETEDAAWNNSAKAQAFAGAIVIEHYTNYSDLGEIGISTLFTITAYMTDGETTDFTLEI